MMCEKIRQIKCAKHQINNKVGKRQRRQRQHVSIISPARALVTGYSVTPTGCRFGGRYLCLDRGAGDCSYVGVDQCFLLPAGRRRS